MFPLAPLVPKPQPVIAYFDLRLPLQPSKIVKIGANDSAELVLGVLDEKLKIVLNLNSETKALPIDYQRIMCNVSLVPNIYTPIDCRSPQTSIPLMLLQIALKREGWIGEAEIGGILTNLPHGEYVFKVELVDPSLIFGEVTSTAILTTAFSKIFELV
ncbi:uncharacterized protein I303_100314 [Kwoniella dejecticola CBS 10117]|uniref:Uncharacterized protein n=1 Tax=Kwoniella dejecticola CBS 10117 TaxID=1296121 RepID=A0A1A6AEJ9_9TREE|nr:uncharacterized protein I303_00314 [Kwoniella dejecticola CBS 10117]OBR88497.1 hypothetical protein I303_00314 [Kwoniella dejecticola CBS 10117]